MINWEPNAHKMKDAKIDVITHVIQRLITKQVHANVFWKYFHTKRVYAGFFLIKPTQRITIINNDINVK